MRTYFVFLIFIKSLFVFSQPATDKILHFGAGYIISFGSYEIFESQKTAFNISFCSGAIAGSVKEGIDLFGFGNASVNDLEATVMGALCGTVSFKVNLNFKARKKGNLDAWKGTDYERHQVFVDDSLEIVKHRCYRLDKVNTVSID